MGWLRQWPDAPRVEVLQRLLTEKGRVVEPTGFFDDAAREAVMALEEAANIPVDGLVGRVTWQQLIAPVRRGDTGGVVFAAGRMLAEDGVARPARPRELDCAIGRRRATLTETYRAPGDRLDRRRWSMTEITVAARSTCPPASVVLAAR